MKLVMVYSIAFILMILNLTGCATAQNPTNGTSTKICVPAVGSMSDSPMILPSLTGITKLGTFGGSNSNCIGESETVVFNNQVLLVANTQGFVTVYDWKTQAMISQTRDLSANFNSALVYNDTLYVFSTESPKLKMTYTTDLQNWSEWEYIFDLGQNAPTANQFYNTSVIHTDQDGFVMAFEVSGEPGQRSYSWHIATSSDLRSWTTKGILFSQEYSACPLIRYSNGYYQFIYLSTYTGAGLVSVVARTQDFINYEKSSTVFLASAPGEGVNNSDVSINEFNGQVYINYVDGNQGGWSNQMIAIYDGTMEDMFNQLWNGQ